MKRPFEQVFYDDEDMKYYAYRPDCPDDPYHEITLDGAIELTKVLSRFENDARERSLN